MSCCESCCGEKTGAAFHVITSMVAGILCVANLVFFFALTVLCVAIIVAILITLCFQSALPASVGAAFGVVLLTAVAIPWLSAVLASIVDFQCWPIRYGLMRASLKELLGVASATGVPAGNESERGENWRRLAWYSVPLIIWIISWSVGIAAGEDGNVGTVLFIVLALTYAVVNMLVDVIKLKGRTMEESAMLFVLFGGQRGVFPSICFIFLFFTAVSVVAKEKSMIQGGDGAIAVSFIMIIAAIAWHFYIFYTEKYNQTQVFVARSKSTYLLAAVDLLGLIISGSIIAGVFSGNDSKGVWVFFVLVLATYALLIWQNVTVSLEDSRMIKKRLRTVGHSSRLQQQNSLYTDDVGSAEQLRSSIGGGGSDTPRGLDLPLRSASQLNPGDAAGSSNNNNTTTSEIRNRRFEPQISSVDGDTNTEMALTSEASTTHDRNSSSNDNNINNDDNDKAQPLVSRCSDMNFTSGGARSADGGQDDRTSHHHQPHQIVSGGGTGTGDGVVGGGGDAGGGSESALIRQFSGGLTEYEKEEIVGQRTLVKRIANACMGITVVIVFLASLLNTGGNNRPELCPGSFPGTNESVTRFTACDIKFDGGLNIVDFAAIEQATYFPLDATFDKAMKMYFPNDNVTRTGQRNAATSYNYVGVRYFGIRFPKRNVTVVAVRGSSRSLDWLIDLYLTSDAFCLQLGTALLPITFGSDLSATLVDVISSIKFGMRGYADPVMRETRLLQAKYPYDAVYIAGHSLGGQVSGVSAAVLTTQAMNANRPDLAVRSVGFSPIGIGLQRKRYGFKERFADRALTVVYPRGDIVPGVDKQLGNVQHIVSAKKCNAKNAMCHSMTNTKNALSDVCGDPLGRMSFPSGKPFTCPKPAKWQT